ncbi:MAG: hypothetical protein Q9201_001344 [Fulgogasparrea decipioides]
MEAAQTERCMVSKDPLSGAGKSIWKSLNHRRIPAMRPQQLPATIYGLDMEEDQDLQIMREEVAHPVAVRALIEVFHIVAILAT